MEDRNMDLPARRGGRLAELAARAERRRRLGAMLKEMESELAVLEQKLEELRGRLADEERDVEKLEGVSAAAVVFSLLGQKERRLEKERQDAAAARLKYSAAAKQRDELHARIDELWREFGSLSGAEEEFDRAFAQARSRMQGKDGLSGLESELGRLDERLREIDEAIAAGEQAAWQAGNVGGSLDSAAGWGMWDMFGGGMLSSMAKHSHLDEAQAGMEQLQYMLSRFRSELADVDIDAAGLTAGVDGFMQAADMFFDNVIVDWAVQSEINRSQESLDWVTAQIRSALGRLYEMKGQCESRRADCERRIAELVIAAD